MTTHCRRGEDTWANKEAGLLLMETLNNRLLCPVHCNYWVTIDHKHTKIKETFSSIAVVTTPVYNIHCTINLIQLNGKINEGYVPLFN